MNEVFKILIGIAILILGVPIGNVLRKKTQEEIKIGQKWFKLIVFFSLFFGFVGLIFQYDWIMFGFFFIAIVTSRSLIRK